MLKLNKKVAASLAAGAVVVAGGGVAYAFWTTTGTGTDNSTSTATVANVTYHSTFSAASLQPGTSVSVAWTATNASPTSLSVAAPTVTITSDKLYDGTHSCAAFLSLDGAPTGGLVPAHTIAGDGSVSLGSANLSMTDPSDTNQNGCLGQKVTLALSNT